MKIAIIGYSGAGKSTLAKTLATHYNTALLYLDKAHYQSGWIERDNQEALKMVEEFLDNNNTWVIDGNYSKRYFTRRMFEADTIIFLNYNRFYCLFKAIQRSKQYKNQTRESMSDGCIEKMDFEFIKWILIDGRSSRKRYWYKQIKQDYKDKLIEFKNVKQLNAYLKKIGINSIIK